MATSEQLAIALLGATGNIGSKVLTEALSRGHTVTGIARNVGAMTEAPTLTAWPADTASIDDLAAGFAAHDLAIVSVRWNTNRVDDVLEALRAAGTNRAIFVVGAGSLYMPDGQLAFDYNTARGLVAPTSESALAAYRVLQTVTDLDWTAVSPSMSIEPGVRTGVFQLGTDQLLFDADGKSRISQEDFAVAIVDEAEQPAHSRARFTVGY